jgi:hypothetical protein
MAVEAAADYMLGAGTTVAGEVPRIVGTDGRTTEPSRLVTISGGGGTVTITNAANGLSTIRGHQPASGTAQGISILGGSAQSGNGSGGAVTIDGGTLSGIGNNGTISIGTANASALTIGRSGVTTTINGTLALTNALAIGQGGTGQTTAQAAINTLSAVSGATAGDVLTKVGANAAWAAPTGGGDVVFADAPGSTHDIASVSDVVIVSKSLTGLAAGDTVKIEVFGTLLNNSGGTRTYSYTVALGAVALLIADGTTHVTHASNRATHQHKGVVSIVSTSDARIKIYSDRGIPQAASTGQSAAATTGSVLSIRKGWDGYVNNLTGTQTVEFRIQSSATGATQTFYLDSYVIRVIKKAV